MKAGMSSQPLAVIDLVLDALHDQGDGTWTADHAGQTVSCQADGSIGYRPLGTTGPWERFLKLDAKTILFCPEGKKAYVFAFCSQILNT